MNIENFTLSDHADNNHGKLSVFGIFDRITSPKFPIQHAHCCLSLRMRFQRSEEGKHHVKIVLVDADGRPQIFQYEQDIVATVTDGFDTGTANMVINLNNLPIERPGSYYWDLVFDGQLISRLHLYAQQVGHQQQAA